MSHAILVVEDEAVLGKNIRQYLERQGHEARHVGDGAAALEEMQRFRPDLVVLDYNLPGIDGLELIGRIRSREPEVPIVMITGHGSVEVAVNAMKAGASDYLSKPISLAELKLVIEKVLKTGRLQGAIARLQNKVAGGVDDLLGASPAMTVLKQRMRQIIQAERSMSDGQPPVVLVTGETGTGKELIARALHFEGTRRDMPFVEINCASIPANLLEAELFGYERGAFTDARQRKLGLVETADGGTLFLDEIGEVELAVQAKLLKLLEEKRVRRLGGARESQVDVRIVAATNRRLEQMVQEGRFRADLFYRLRILEVHSPPLRERGGDVLLLARHFLEQQAKRYGKTGLRFDLQAERDLERYIWPGNVRELRNAIEQAVLLASDPVVRTDAFPFCHAPRPAVPQALSAGAAARINTARPEFAAQGTRFVDIERDLLLQALRSANWNVTRAAKLLGLSRDTLRYRIEKFDIRAEGADADGGEPG